MKTFRFEDHFGWPARDIIQFFVDGVDLVPQEMLDDVKAKKELVSRREGTKAYYKSEWCVHGQIPPLAQKIVRPEMLTFIEDTVWDDEAAMFSTKITPHFFKKQLVCETTSKYWDDGNGGAKRDFRGKIHVNIPIIGPVVESAIVDGLRKNNKQNYNLMIKELTRRLGPEKKK